jgi:hypothetical protein
MLHLETPTKRQKMTKTLSEKYFSFLEKFNVESSFFFKIFVGLGYVDLG